jgi:2-polyprenyl-6-methoxyphenol hydroxylase-like FAD-dependent oxidoreductase
MTTTQTSTSPCQVLIIGAGPTGLVLAAQLLARGVTVRIIEKREGPPVHSRAVSLTARTLELLDTMGLAETFVAHGHPVRGFRMYAGARTLLNLDMTHNGSRYGFMLSLPQDETERLLRAHLRGLGGTIEQGVELIRFSDSGDSVDATLRDTPGREFDISADYLVGCDGAHSRVRTELGLAFEGLPYPQEWLLADVALDGVGREDQTHAFYRPDGLPLVCVPLGQRRWRVVLPNAGDRAGAPPSLDEIRDLVEQRAPRRITVSDPRWLSCFRCQLRSASSYRRGRVLVAGDAAHIHSPAGGQGMNTGMMDAHNLAWKLALVAAGASEGLLESYGEERIPAASSVLGFTDRLIGWATMRNPVKRALRDTLLPVAGALPVVQKRAARRLSQTSVTYPTGRLVLASRNWPGPKPGHRFEDLEVRMSEGTARARDVLRKDRHVLLVFDTGIRTALRESGIDRFAGLVDIVHSNPWPGQGQGAAASAAFALVRPDGILAAGGSRQDTHMIIDYLRQIAPAHATAAREAVRMLERGP